MFDFKIAADDKATMYRDLASALEGLVAGVADASMHLHCAVGSLAAKPVRPVVAHGDAVGECELHIGLRHAIHFPCRLADQQAKHFRLGG